MALASCDDKLLICDYYGNISLRDTCCPEGPCGPDPEPCPPCCTKLVGGEFIDGVWYFEDDAIAGYQLKVEVRGIGEDRLVCDNESITVKFYLVVPDPDTFGPPHFAYASWDYMWDYISHTPEVDNADGRFFAEGLIDWGSKNDLEYEFTLEYDACWQSINRQAGEIVVGFKSILTEVVIAFEDCPGYYCCEETFECTPCCWYIEMGDGSDPARDGILDPDEQIIIWYIENDGVIMRVTTPNREVFCADGGGNLSIDVQIIPSVDADPVTYEPEICVEHDGWYRQNDLPATQEDCDNYDYTTCADPKTLLTFGVDLRAFGCEDNPCAGDGCFAVPGGITVTAKTHLGGLLTLSLGELVPCVETDSPETCCCPCPPCTFPEIDPVANVSFFYDDGFIAVQFNQVGSSRMKSCGELEAEGDDCNGCSFEIPGRWSITDFVNGGDPVVFDGSAKICFSQGTYTFDGGDKGGQSMSYSMEGTCDGLQTSPPDPVYFLSFDANGALCDAEGEQ